MKIFCVKTNKDDVGEAWRRRFYAENRVFTCCLKHTDLNVVQPGDIVLVYHNNKRVVGVGVALENAKKIDCGEKFFRFVPVKWLWFSLGNDFIDIDEIGNVSQFRGAVTDWTPYIDKAKLLEKVAEKISEKGLR